jgi:methyl-accepting chemotaxis protein
MHASQVSLEKMNAATPSADKTVNRPSNTIEQVKMLVSRLEGRFTEIASIAGLISDISKHTKMLSFNATIESARAGDAGRGFAVVASEVRALAERTSEATSDINRMLQDVNKEIVTAVKDVETAEVETLIQGGIRIATLEAAKLEILFTRIATVIHGFKQTIQGLSLSGEGLTRRTIDNIMAEYLRKNEDLLALSCCALPNVIDGADSNFIGAPGHDGTGRYIPYWNRGGGQIQLEPLTGYDTPGLNDWYELPRKAGHDVMIEPYDYPVAGRVVQITSLMSPFTLKGVFAGVIGTDYALERLQADMARIKPFTVGALMLLSNSAAYVAHPDRDTLGKPADDLSLDAKAAIRGGNTYHYIDAGGVVRIFHPLKIGEDTRPWSVMVTFEIAAALRSGSR